jgi:hypothetical protein
MPYKQFEPQAVLSTYIDAYWEVTSDDSRSFTERIMPDCCVDIIINLGTDVRADDSGVIMKNKQAYLLKISSIIWTIFFLRNYRHCGNPFFISLIRYMKEGDR